MARREIVDCDRCGAREPVGWHAVTLRTGREPAPYSTVDLCPACMAACLGQLLNAKGFDDNLRAEWVKFQREGGGKVPT